MRVNFDNIPEIAKKYILETCGRMPESDDEINDFLDLINMCKEYAVAFEMERHMTKRFIRKIGFKTTNELKVEMKERFSHSTK